MRGLLDGLQQSRIHQKSTGQRKRSPITFTTQPTTSNPCNLTSCHLSPASPCLAGWTWQDTENFSLLSWVSGGAGGCPLQGAALKAGYDKTVLMPNAPQQHNRCSHHPSLEVPSSFIPGAAPGPQKHTDYFGCLCAQPKTRAQNPRFHVQLKQEKKLLATQDLEGK